MHDDLGGGGRIDGHGRRGECWARIRRVAEVATDGEAISITLAIENGLGDDFHCPWVESRWVMWCS